MQWVTKNIILAATNNWRAYDEQQTETIICYTQLWKQQQPIKDLAEKWNPQTYGAFTTPETYKQPRTTDTMTQPITLYVANFQQFSYKLREYLLLLALC